MTTARKTRAIAVYLRVSTDDQDHEAQRLEILRWLNGHGIEVPPELWFVDTASGVVMKRNALRELQRAAFAGEVGTVVFFAIDRLARDLIEGMVEIKRWAAAKVRMIFVKDCLEIDPNTFLGDHLLQLICSLRLGFAAMERARTKERQGPGIEAARQQQEEVKRQHRAGVSVADLAIHFRRKPETIVRMISAPEGKLWWSPRDPGKGRRKENASNARICELMRKGCTSEEICKALNISIATFRRRMRSMGGMNAVRTTLAAEQG